MNLGGWLMLAFVMGWVLAQMGKIVALLMRYRGDGGMKVIMQTALKSGGMPSGHTAGCVAGSVFLGMSVGWMSVPFAMCICMTAIIIYDAMNVRYAVGEQGKVLNRIEKEQGRKALNVVEGHTLPQVIGGAVIGVGVGLLIYILSIYWGIG